MPHFFNLLYQQMFCQFSFCFCLAFLFCFVPLFIKFVAGVTFCLFASFCVSMFVNFGWFSAE